jgi:hypothetical protein
MPDVITASEYLIINSTPLATPAWRITDLTPLWSGPDLRGGDRVLPGATGVIAYRRRATATRLILPGVIWGDKTRENVATSDVRTGLHDNLDAFYTAIVAPVASDPGTHAATWVKPGTDKTANVHVVGFTPRQLSPRSIRFTMELSLPTGRFA